MTSRKLTFCAAVVALLACTACAIAASRYPNLDDAVGSLNSAADHIRLAQHNHPDSHFAGHAERALHLIEDARAELNAARSY